MISQNPLKGNYYDAKSRVENLLSLLEKSTLSSLEGIDTLMSMLNAKKNDFRIWVTASHNLFLSLYPHLNDSQKTEISTIASTISSRWYNVDGKLRKQKKIYGDIAYRTGRTIDVVAGTRKPIDVIF